MRKGQMLTLAALAALTTAGWSLAQPRQQQPSPQQPNARQPQPAVAPPSTGPNAAAAPVALDDATPRGALKVLLSAMQTADADKLHALLLARSPLEERMVDAIVKRADAEKRFRGAVEKAYGAEGARALVNDNEAQNAAGMAQLDAAEEKVEGEQAHVAAGQGSDMRLQKVNGKWRVPIAQFAASPAEKDAAAAADQQGPGAASQGPPPSTNPAGDGIAGKEKAIEQKLDDEKLAVQIINDMTGEIEAGKYKTPQEAADAIRMKMMVEMMKRNGAAPDAGQAPGAPATQPATEPSPRTS